MYLPARWAFFCYLLHSTVSLPLAIKLPIRTKVNYSTVCPSAGFVHSFVNLPSCRQAADGDDGAAACEQTGR